MALTRPRPIPGAVTRPVYAAFDADPGPAKMAPHKLKLLTDALAASAVELGDYDNRIVRWLARLGASDVRGCCRADYPRPCGRQAAPGPPGPILACRTPRPAPFPARWTWQPT